MTRAWQGIVALIVLATLVFVLARIIGNPVDMMLGPSASLQDAKELTHKLGLDQPYYVQYGQFMWGLLRGDVGASIKFREPVTRLFFQFFPNTLKLALVTFTIGIMLGFALGMLSATSKGGALDRCARVLSVIGMSAPAFWIGLMLMLVFAVYLRLLPPARMEGPASYVLPALTWSFYLLAGTARLVRSSMLSVMDTEFVKLARIKGVSESVVVWKHSLRNALAPVITFAGVQLAFLLHGSVVVESIFAWPGVGRLIYQGIVGRDYPLVQGCLLIVGCMIIIISILVDVLYCLLDPRIRLTGGVQ